MILSNASYSAEHSRKKVREQPPEKLLTDRSAYILYLESQLERVTAACMTVHSFEERLEDVASHMHALDEKVLNTGRLGRCIQEDAQEAVAGLQSTQHQLADRLAAVEDAVQGLLSNDSLAMEAVPSGRDGADNSLQLEGTRPHVAADGAPFGSHLQSLAELLTPHQAHEVQEAVGHVQCAFSDIRTSLATLQRSKVDRSAAAPAEQPRAARQPESPAGKQPQERCWPSGCQAAASRPSKGNTWPKVQLEQVDHGGWTAPIESQGPAGCAEELQPRSPWPPAQPAPRPPAACHGKHSNSCDRPRAAAAQRDGSAPPSLSVQTGGQQRQQPNEQQHRWHWRAEAAALQVEQAACKRKAAAGGHHGPGPPAADMAVWQGASRRATDAAEPTAPMAAAAHYADENQQRDGAEPCDVPGTASCQQWRRVDPPKASSVEFGGTAGTPHAAAGLQRQQRLQQLYRELQLLDGQALQT